jgi:hypothetical protein
MQKMEKVYQSEALINGWESISSHRAFWFDTTEEFAKSYTLDKKGIPIVWDEETFEVEETRQATVDDTCTIILTNKKKKVLVLIHRDLDNVVIQGGVVKEVDWGNYNSEGLWAIKKHCTGYTMEAVILNPKIKTLEKFKVVKAIIKKVIETRNLMEGKDHEPAQKKDTED